MSRVHVYTAPIQPLVAYQDANFEPPMLFTTAYRKVYPCGRCGRRRWAQNLSIQVYYDTSYIFCNTLVYRRADDFPFEYGRFCPK